MKRGREAAPIGDVLQELFPRIRVLRTDWFEELVKAWPELVGPAVAAHCKPARLEKGQLTVHVDTHVWQFELSRTGKKPILDNIRKKFGPGKVRDCLFRLDPGR